MMIARTVQAHFITTDGAPAAGRVTFTPSQRLVDYDTKQVIVPLAISADLDPDGRVAIDLLVTDGTGPKPIDGTDWHWQVREHVGPQSWTYRLDLPSADGPLDLADVPGSRAVVAGDA